MGTAVCTGISCLLLLVLMHAPAQAVTMAWNTFMGSANDDKSWDIAVDGSGTVYVTGEDNATWGSPINPHTGAGDQDAFVAKIADNGTLLWNTFMGAAGNDFVNSIAVDGSGTVYVTGISAAAWGSPINPYTVDQDAFVAKLDGNGTLLWNTFMGAAGYDFVNGIAVDGSGNVYVTGHSAAAWGSPINAHAGNLDAFVAKFDGSGNRLWNTFMGSASSDHGSGIAIDGAGTVYVTGDSDASWGSPINSHAGSIDAFVAKFNSSGSRLWNTFMGSAFVDYVYGIAVDGSGDVYVTGDSGVSWGSPVNPHAGFPEAFVAKFDSSGNRLWNTFMGAAGYDSGHGIAAYGSGTVYVTGYSDATWGSPVNPHAGSDDAFVAKLDRSGNRLWNRFMGSANDDYGWGTATDESGNLYVTGYSTAAWDSPINPHAGGNDAFVAKFLVDCLDADGDGYGTGPDCLGADCNDTAGTIYPGAVETCNGRDDDCDNAIDDGCTGSTTTIFSADFTADPVQGPAPLEAQFRDASSPGASGHTWDFGDGTGGAGTGPAHTYAASGDYTVSLTVTGPGPAAVKIAKVAYIRVSETAPAADFTASKTDGPAPLTVLFTDTSTGAITGREWDFGDGTTGTPARMRHTYAAAGQYTVSLKVAGPGGTSIKTREAFITARPGLRTSAISGQVSGAAQGGVDISLSGTNLTMTAQTGADGSYSFAGVPNGLYRLTPIRPGYVFEPAGRQIRMLGRDKTGIDFTAASRGPDIQQAYAAPGRAPADGMTQFSLFARVAHPDGLAAIRSVTADLTGIGGSAQALLRDDGTDGDAAAGDGQYTLVTAASADTDPGLKPLGVTARDTGEWARTVFVPMTVYRKFTDTIDPGAQKAYQITNDLTGQTVVFICRLGGVSAGGSQSAERAATSGVCTPTVQALSPSGEVYAGQTGGQDSAAAQTTVEVPNAEAGQWTFQVSNPCATTISIDLESTIAGTGIVSGVVVETRTGEGITGAMLRSTGGISAQSDSGVYVMLHPSGIFSLTGSAAGFVPATHSLTVNSGGYTELNMALDNGTLTGACFLKSFQGEAGPRVETLRRFRDRVLGATDQGKRYTRLYYRYSSEILQMMQNDTELADDIYRCTVNLMPLAEKMLHGKEAVPDAQQHSLLTGCLEKMRAHAQPALKGELELLLKDLEKQQPLNRLLN
jgi:PKD repeat protein